MMKDTIKIDNKLRAAAPRRLRLEVLEPRLQLAAQVTGIVWQDVDADGFRDVAEPIATGAQVYLDLNDNGAVDGGEPTEMTDSSGAYTFDNLTAGSYVVRQITTDSWVQTYPEAQSRLAVVDSDRNLLTIRQADGTIEEQVAIPPGSSNSERPRELVVDEMGRVHVYNGTFDPRLSTYAPEFQTWSHLTADGWWTVNNVYYGSVAYVDGYVFASDMKPSNGSTLPAGLIRFNLETGVADRFATRSYEEVVAGLDGLIYAGVGGGWLDVYDPTTLAYLGTSESTGWGTRTVAVDDLGQIYFPLYDGIGVFSYEGEQVAMIPVNTTGSWREIRDIDLAPNGQIVVATADGDVFVSDPARTHFDWFDAANYYWGAYAAWYDGHDVTAAATVDVSDGQSIAVDFGVYHLAPTATGTPELVATYDTGIGGDLKTRYNNADSASKLHFQVDNTTPGALVTLYADGVLIGSSQATGTSTLIETDGTTLLANGTHAITAIQEFVGFPRSIVSPELTIEVDATSPEIMVDVFTTDDLRPPLSGTVSDPDATVTILVNGFAYTAQVTPGPAGSWADWTIDDNMLQADLTIGQYDVHATAVDEVGNIGIDSTLGELTIVAPTSVITGSVWDDQNNNSMRDPVESGWADITVYLDLNRNAEYDAEEPMQLTSADDLGTPEDEAGRYSFENLYSGEYNVRTLLPAGISQTTSLVSHWPDVSEIERIDSKHAERLLGFGTHIAAHKDRFAVSSNAPVSMSDSIALVSVYQVIGEKIFLEGEIPIPLETEQNNIVRSLAIEEDLLLIGLANRTVGEAVYGGEVLVYRRHEGRWEHEATLSASDVAVSNSPLFGAAVAIDGETVVVGAIGDDTVGANTGAVYIFEYSNGNWVETQKLTEATTWNQGQFGNNIDVSGDVLVVGVPRQPTGVPNIGGQAFVYENFAGVWTQTAVLQSPDAQYGEQVGYDVAISNEIIALGTDSAYRGHALIFKKTAGTWEFQEAFKSSDVGSGDDFGVELDFVGSNLVVGAPFRDAEYNWSGAAYVFTEEDSSWVETARLTRPAPGPIFFGSVMAGLNSGILVAQAADFSLARGAGAVWYARPTIVPDGVGVVTLLDSEVQATSIGLTLLPSMPTLVAEHDSGFSDQDAVTNRNNQSVDSKLAFAVTDVPVGVTVELYIDEQYVSSAVATESGALLETDGLTLLSEGAHAVTATIRYANNEVSPFSVPLALFVDSVTPEVSFTPQTTAINQPDLIIEASEDVTRIVLRVDGRVADAQLVANQWVVYGGSLAAFTPGIYDIEIEAADLAGNVAYYDLPDALTITSPGNIKGKIFEDLNGNGRQDLSESGLAGVTLFLDLDGDGKMDTLEPRVQSSFDDPATTLINEQGAYQFTNLPEGKYTVRVYAPDGQTVISPGNDDQAWSDALLVDQFSLLRSNSYESLGRVMEVDNNILITGNTFYSAYTKKYGISLFERESPAHPWGEVLVVDELDAGLNNRVGFGSDVAVGDGYVVASAPNESVGEADGAGVLLIYEPTGDGGVWESTEKLSVPNSERLQFLGGTVKAVGNTIAASTYRGYSYQLHGGAYVFSRLDASADWEVAGEFHSHAEGFTPTFGRSVALSENMLAVSSHIESGTGVVYLYHRTLAGPGNWQFLQILHPEAKNNRSQFGRELELDDSTLVVRSNAGVDVYDVSDLLGAGPVYLGNLDQLPYSNADEILSLQNDTLVAINGSYSSPAVEVWRRQGGSAHSWKLVNRLDRSLVSAVAVDGDQLLVSEIRQEQTPEYSGIIYVYETGGVRASRRITLGPGHEMLDVSFGLVSSDTNFPGDFNRDWAIDEEDFEKWGMSFGIDAGADADNDGDSDGFDFLAWQRNFDTTKLGGDFDADSDVDTTDLNIWESSFGRDNGADADRDGDSDGADFLVWQRNFGIEPQQGGSTSGESNEGSAFLLGQKLFESKEKSVSQPIDENLNSPLFVPSSSKATSSQHREDSQESTQTLSSSWPATVLKDLALAISLDSDEIEDNKQPVEDQPALIEVTANNYFTHVEIKMSEMMSAELNRLTSRSDEKEDGELQWLSDELLDLVFG